jgi:replicative DNA helicase
MSAAPALDLEHPVEAPEIAHLPANIEAEQALLGALLYDNSAYERLADSFRSVHFYEPFHQRLFVAIERAIQKGQLAEPVVLADVFERDPAYQELGGIRYLAELVDHAPPAANTPEYARVIWELARRRELIRIGGDIAQRANEPDDGEDSADMLEDAEAALYALGETGAAQQGFVGADAYIGGAVGLAAKAFQNDGGLSGISTGLIDLDRKIGGLHDSDLVILAARPSMGKTSLAVNIGLNVAKAYHYESQPDGTRKTAGGGIVGFFSLEMSAEQLGLRLLAEVSGVSGDKLRKGEIDATDFGRVRDAGLELAELPLFVDATGGIPLAKLAARARRLKRRQGLDLLIIDYLQLVTAPGRKGEGRVQEVSEITQGLKALAKELNVPVIALAQLSRQVETREDKRPQLSDLRESGSIEQDADMVMFIYREEYYLGRTEPRPDTAEHLAWQEKMDLVRGQADLIIGKQRHGPIGTVKLAFNEDLTKFGNLAQEGRYGGAGRSPYRDE